MERFRNITFSCPLAHEINMIFNAGLIFTPEVFIPCKKIWKLGSRSWRPWIMIYFLEISQYLLLLTFNIFWTKSICNCPYKFNPYLEPRYLYPVSRIPTNYFLLPSALLRLFFIIYLQRFYLTYSNVWRVHSKTLIECLSILISIQQHVGLKD